MTALPDPNALLQMARALGLHPVVTHAPDSEAIAVVRVYRTELDNRAIVTWEATGIVCHAGLSWAPCSLAEASAVLEVAAREAADERAVRAVAEAARRDAENAVTTAEIEAECSGIEVCGCDESQWWKRRAASLEAARHEAETTASAALADMVRRGIEICGCEESAWLRGENERLTWEIHRAMAEQPGPDDFDDREAARLADELLSATEAIARTRDELAEANAHIEYLEAVAQEPSAAREAADKKEARLENERLALALRRADESVWRIRDDLASVKTKLDRSRDNENWLESEVARFSARLCEEQGEALDLERDLRAAEVATMMARDDTQRWKNAAEEATAELVLARQALADRAGAPGEHDALPHERGWICEQSVWWHREAARLAKELKAALAENEQLHDALAAAHEPSAQCGGPGTCHGTMRWCDSCGDVGSVCDAVACDVHARLQRF